MSRFLAISASVLAAAVAAGFAVAATQRAAPAKPSCPAAWRAGWQALANKIRAPVYCPGWMPSPLDGKIGGYWSDIDSVSKDRSYLMSFAWKDKEDEIHVNFRGYPGRTRIPTCRQVDLKAGKRVVTSTPCFAAPKGHKRAGAIAATVYSVNQDADQWHILYAWRRAGSLYTLSEHVAPPLSYQQVIRNLDRMLRSLVLVEPQG
jgi:hypothetical protein